MNNSSDPSSDNELLLSMKRHTIWAIISTFALVLGIGGWATYTKISGAVIAAGVIVVESNIKQIQHREGGIVKHIYVKNGDEVKAGEPLLQLDDTAIQANLDNISKQLDVLHALEARLKAEQLGAKKIDFPNFSFQLENQVENLKAIHKHQSELYDARKLTINGRREQLKEQIAQFEKLVEGHKIQKTARTEELELITGELTDLEKLLSQELVSATRVTALKREKVRIEGDRGNIISQIAQASEAVSERKIQIFQIEQEFRADVLQQLQDTQLRISQLEEQRIGIEDQLSRVGVIAPRSGFVHNLNVHTIGGVISPGETILTIVPKEDLLVIEAQVLPVDIDQLVINQETFIRLPSFDQRTTPQLKAKLKIISADLLQDPTTGLSFYTARFTIADDELQKLNGRTLVPGMPVEAFIQTEERTVISYLVKPISDQLAHALKER